MEINEMLDKIFGEKKLTDKKVLTKMFKLLVIEKENDYKEFKEHVSSINCICGIKAYASFINKFDNNELKEIIKETGITEDILDDFFHILNGRINQLVAEVGTTLGILSSKIYDVFERDEDDKSDLDNMSKEELIHYIKNKL